MTSSSLSFDRCWTVSKEPVLDWVGDMGSEDDWRMGTVVVVSVTTVVSAGLFSFWLVRSSSGSATGSSST